MRENETTRIVGMVLVRNEDRFLGQVLENIAGFCDKIIIADHMSDDATPQVVEKFCAQYRHAEAYTITELKRSHELLEPFAGQPVWIFAVDGDEIYDPDGLKIFRKELLAGTYDKWWMVFGNVLNCTNLDKQRRWAKGYLAPPCRSISKLYNFSMIHSWHGSSGERLHGGAISFKEGYGRHQRCVQHETIDWDNAIFRCLHMCFLQRSSKQRSWRGRYLPRPNPADILSRTMLQQCTAFLKKSMGIPVAGKQEWKVEKFTRGDLVSKDVSCFFNTDS